MPSKGTRRKASGELRTIQRTPDNNQIHFMTHIIQTGREYAGLQRTNQ